jgi:hypothetical protein
LLVPLLEIHCIQVKPLGGIPPDGLIPAVGQHHAAHIPQESGELNHATPSPASWNQLLPDI